MVEWTAEEKKIIQSLWKDLNVADVGHRVLARLLFVYPWTRRYFKNFNLGHDFNSIYGNSHVTSHGNVVLTEVDKAVHHLGGIKELLHNLSLEHSEKLGVDPHNFKLIGQIIIIVLAQDLGKKFTADAQEHFEKFVSVLADAMSREYH